MGNLRRYGGCGPGDRGERRVLWRLEFTGDSLPERGDAGDDSGCGCFETKLVKQGHDPVVSGVLWCWRPFDRRSQVVIEKYIFTDWRSCDVSEQKEGNSSRKGGKLVLAACAVVIVILLAAVIYLLMNRQEDEEPVNRNVVVNEDNVEEILTQMEEKEIVPVGYYETTMNSTWYFENGSTPSDNAYVENAATNTNAVYFDVTRVDTEETIYESPILPVGSHLENISLDTELPSGTYDCLVTYHLLDEENKSISTLKVTVTVVIDQ